ncbi:MAG: sialate O-acetylesterase [Chitinophagaceae bacterium BSSC1]|nr:MAG: sialate O-acetylesterase [Chitinophagaceae bacterium BSSC1]
MYSVKKSVFLFCLILLGNHFLANAKIVLPGFFNDHMVLQQQSQPAIWGWARPNQKIIVQPSWTSKKFQTKSDATGKWRLTIETIAAGGPYEMRISDGEQMVLTDLYLGEVWLCSGQSNMEMPMKGFKDQALLHSNDAIFHSKNPLIRFYTVPRATKALPQDSSKSANWKIAEAASVADFSATAYYFGKHLFEQLQIPIGLINISYSGTPIEAFMSPESLKAFPEIPTTPTTEPKPSNKMASTVYHGMLQPFWGFEIKGMIWYQGETNYDRPGQYEHLFTAFIKEARASSHQAELPFYFAQIAPFDYGVYATGGAPVINSAFLREAQSKVAASVENTGMAVLMDIGEEKSIHPMDKETGGKRLAYWALTKTYGMKGFAFQSPSYDSVQIKDNQLTLFFKNAPNGFTGYGKPLNGFEMAGVDKVFYAAEAKIVQGKIVLTAKEVTKPIAARYAFKNFIAASVFSTEGFPLSSFRTDQW